MEFKIGEFILKQSMPERKEYIWIERLDGEGMEVKIEKLNKLLEDFFQKEF